MLLQAGLILYFQANNVTKLTLLYHYVFRFVRNASGAQLNSILYAQRKLDQPPLSKRTMVRW